MEVECPLSKPSDVFKNLVGGFRPDERLGTSVMLIYELANGGFELGDAAVRAAPQPFVGQFGKQRSTKLIHDP